LEGCDRGEELACPIMSTDVIIVGGGFSGLASAVKLVEAGYRPLVLERRHSLGGRAFSLTHEETGDTVDNGQHVFMQCCHAITMFLKTIGSEPIHFESKFSIRFIDGEGRRHRLESPRWLPPSLGLFFAFLRFGPTSFGDALGLSRAASTFKRAPQGISVSDWLDETRQSKTIRDNFWRPLCISVMNAPPETAPAAELVSVLSEAFSTPGGAFMGWSTVGLSNLYPTQAKKFIEGGGGEVRSGVSVSNLEYQGNRITLSLRDDSTVSSDAVILAVPPPRVRDLLSTACPDLANQLRTYSPSPILGINLWFERSIINEPFVGFLGYTIEWAFNKPALYGPSDQASKGHISLVISASTNMLSTSKKELVDLSLQDLRKAGLIGKDETPLHSLVIHEKQATYLRPYATAAIPATTEVPGLYLAGDWTDTGLPPTIEGAVRSGNHAADLVIEQLKTEKPRD
jgi:squalene-associated FAD-dependent desaturase